MNHIKKFNESETFKNTDYDIKMFFTDYTDENPKALTIENGLVYNNNFIKDTVYMKNVTNYRKAKLITLNIGEQNGIHINGKSCITDLEMLSNVVFDIKRFYALSEEKINYTLYTDYAGLNVQFITLGDMVKPEESKSEKIDNYLKRISECIKKKGWKRVSIKGDWIDISFPKKMDRSYEMHTRLYRISNGQINLDNTTNEIDRELITIRNEITEDGLQFNLGGGDQQVTLKLVKI